MKKLAYVQWIQNNNIQIFCEDESKIKDLKLLGGKKKFFSKMWNIKYINESELPKILMNLRNKGFMFAGGAYGWNPSDIFIYLREKNMVEGEITEVTWQRDKKLLFHKR